MEYIKRHFSDMANEIISRKVKQDKKKWMTDKILGKRKKEDHKYNKCA